MKLSLIVILVFSCQFVFGQLNTPISGPVYEITKKENFNGFIGENDQHLFTLDYAFSNRKKQELNVRRFAQSNMAFVDEVNIYSVLEEEYYNEPKEVFYANDTIFLFSLLTGDKDVTPLLSLELFNQYGERLQYSIVDSVRFDEYYHIKEAEDKKGFLIARHNKFRNLAEQEIYLLALDNSGNTKWKNTLKSPYALQSLTIEEIYYSSNSPVYLLCNYGLNLDNKSIDNELVNNTYALWAYKPENKFLKEFELRLNNRWINGVKMHYDGKGELLISGFTNETRKKTVNGVFSVIINKDFTIKQNHTYKFTKAFLSKFLTAKELDRQKELEDMVLRDLVVLSDGSYFLLSEHYNQYTERNYDPRTNITTTTEHYNYNSIMVSYFDKTGKHIWSDRIPKFQHSINDFGYFSSFAYLQNKNDIFIFFNDSQKNNELELDDYFNYNGIYNNRKFQITQIHLTRDEVVQRNEFLLQQNNEFMLRAKRCNQINPESIYLLGESGRTRKIIKVNVSTPQ